ncbi:Uncharacterised protein [[Clostridium] sordellii]|uniref:hypothetical protein n=1 Tax=Paraclostridium sordellii TaxID=1505 RepID=UPI0005E40937|nr:hypothetical protein [Paeniclostridium sordellii]CEQ11105.1 Uncharacterised protein [[Clostridium] sordellii] [Paeniclostridium sordellii]
MNGDVNLLKSKIETDIEENKINQSIKSIKEFIDKKDYNSAKNSINDKYKEEIYQLDELVNKNIKKEEENIKKQK